MKKNHRVKLIKKDILLINNNKKDKQAYEKKPRKTISFYMVKLKESIN